MPFDPETFYQPGRILLDQELLGPAHDHINTVADTLASGDLSPIPDGILAALAQHAAAINTKAIGPLRIEIATAAEQTPVTDRLAFHLGSLLRRLVEVANSKSTDLTATSIIISEQFRTTFADPDRPND